MIDGVVVGGVGVLVFVAVVLVTVVVVAFVVGVVVGHGSAVVVLFLFDCFPGLLRG